MTTTPDVIIGMDVGKSFHWMHAVTNTGTVLMSRKITQNEHDLFTQFCHFTHQGHHVLVVVDQPKNIGTLTLDCATRAGCDVKYLPGLAMRRAAGILPGDAKTDARDATVIAMTARTLPEALRPIPAPTPQRADLDALIAYDHDCLVDRTRHLNRLHALLLDVNPGFEHAISDHLDSPSMLALLTHYGGPWAMRQAGQTRLRRWATTHTRLSPTLLDTMITAIFTMDHKPLGADTRERWAIPATVKHITDLTTTRTTNDTLIRTLLANDPAYTALLTIPGVGPHTAATLLTTIDITLFPDHEKLASYAGLAPTTHQSGTSTRNTTAPKTGNRALKNALFLSAFAALRCDPHARAFYDHKKTIGKHHNTIIIALANKRLKIMYAIMRDHTPYRTT